MIQFLMVSSFACMCSYRSGSGAIDNTGLLEHVFDQYDIHEVPEKNIEHDFSMVCRQKMFILNFFNG